MSGDTFFRFDLGDFDCICISDGGSDYPVEMLFANAPRALVEEKLHGLNLPVDHVWTPYTFLYVDTGKQKVLVDMGAGPLRPTTGKMVQSLRAAAIAPADIDVVLITHAHPDHVGGTLDDEDRPIYSNAGYFIWRGEWDFWFSDDAVEMSMPRPAAQRFVTSARKNLTAIRERLTFIDREVEILPGIAMMAAPGHTPGHTAISISSGGDRLLYASDTVLHPFHLEHPDWLPIFDILPDKAATSKRRIFDLAADEHAWVIGQHFPPFPSLGHVVKRGDGWAWQPIDV